MTSASDVSVRASSSDILYLHHYITCEVVIEKVVENWVLLDTRFPVYQIVPIYVNCLSVCMSILNHERNKLSSAAIENEADTIGTKNRKGIEILLAVAITTT